ncbi:MAG TPA: nicotinate-nucleotide--dimethylbenzimidazole phosphoribosyltransferase [Polyangiaceae bacterium]|nr:nicotinate-nucleotide--dimethylbenzimidazole phosphoribosyltransferase [Polyangiaceae bacterium]
MAIPSFEIAGPDVAAASAARARQARLTKPAGSLARLEEVAMRIAAWQGSAKPSARPAAAVLFAADHPVTVHGVSAYPPAVTRAMVNNFANGGAAASVLTSVQGLPLHVVDVGVSGDPGAVASSVFRDPVAGDPAGDVRIEDAMSPETYERALAAGVAAIKRLDPDVRIVMLGEMGIGNTTVAAAVAAALLGGEPGLYVGAGTGVAGDALENKRRVVTDAVARLKGERAVHEILRRVGGRDVVALVGAILAALERRALVLVDGFIVSVAALAAVRLVPAARDGLLFGHRSAEHAHGRVLEAMNAEPLLSLGLRLGEASGALTAYPLLELACALHNQMATFESAGVPDREG